MSLYQCLGREDVWNVLLFVQKVPTGEWTRRTLLDDEKRSPLAKCLGISQEKLNETWTPPLAKVLVNAGIVELEKNGKNGNTKWVRMVSLKRQDAELEESTVGSKRSRRQASSDLERSAASRRRSEPSITTEPTSKQPVQPTDPTQPTNAPNQPPQPSENQPHEPHQTAVDQSNQPTQPPNPTANQPNQTTHQPNPTANQPKRQPRKSRRATNQPRQSTTPPDIQRILQAEMVNFRGFLLGEHKARAASSTASRSSNTAGYSAFTLPSGDINVPGENLAERWALVRGVIPTWASFLEPPSGCPPGREFLLLAFSEMLAQVWAPVAQSGFLFSGLVELKLLLRFSGTSNETLDMLSKMGLGPDSTCVRRLEANMASSRESGLPELIKKEVDDGKGILVLQADNLNPKNISGYVGVNGGFKSISTVTTMVAKGPPSSHALLDRSPDRKDVSVPLTEAGAKATNSLFRVLSESTELRRASSLTEALAVVDSSSYLLGPTAISKLGLGTDATVRNMATSAALRHFLHLPQEVGMRSASSVDVSQLLESIWELVGESVLAHKGLICSPLDPEFVLIFAKIKEAGILPEIVKHMFQTLPVFHWCKHLMEGWATDNDVFEKVIAPLKREFNFNKKASEAIVQSTARAVEAASAAAPSPTAEQPDPPPPPPPPPIPVSKSATSSESEESRQDFREGRPNLDAGALFAQCLTCAKVCLVTMRTLMMRTLTMRTLTIVR